MAVVSSQPKVVNTIIFTNNIHRNTRNSSSIKSLVNLISTTSGAAYNGANVRETMSMSSISACPIRRDPVISRLLRNFLVTGTYQDL